MGRIFGSLARFIERVPWWILAVALVLSFGAIPGIINLRTDSSLNTLVPSGSQALIETGIYQEHFGGEPITILLKGPVDEIFSPENLTRIGKLEQDIRSSQHCRSVYGPAAAASQAAGTAIEQINAFRDKMSQDMESADQSAQQPAAAQGTGETDGTLSSSLRALAPDDNHAIIMVIPEVDQPDSNSADLLEVIQTSIDKAGLENISATVISDTGLIDAISSRLMRNMVLLLGLAVLVMIAILFILFRVRWRLLSLLMVGTGAIWTFGLMGFISIPVSMATMAILPILIGLGIDYPVQFHNRYQEETDRNRTAKEALIATLSHMAPAVGVALIATIIGFLTLYISDIPMIRDFGIILAMGIVLCFLIALFLLSSILYLGQKRVSREKAGRSAIFNTGWLEKILFKTSSTTIKKPALVLGIAIILGIAGGAVDHWLPVNTDYEQLIPQNLPELVEMRSLREMTGVSGELRFLVQGGDMTDPVVLEKLKAFQESALEEHPEFVSVNGWASTIYQAAGGSISDQTQVRGLLSALPEQTAQQVISSDRQMASLSFGLQPLPLKKVQDLIDDVVSDSQSLEGISISPVGSMVLGSSTVESVISNRLFMNIFCLAAIFVVLLIIYRRFSRAVFVIFPTALVIGWGSLLMLAAGIPLNPLTAVLGVITTSIGTEFMVLLASRYEEEKARGELPHIAMLTAVERMGKAIVVTGVTTLGGFGVLIASDFVMIRDFGIITLAGIFLCILSSIIVMPALMVWFDEKKLKTSIQSVNN